LDLLLLNIPELEEMREALTNLTPYSVEYRYPGFMATKEDATSCIDIIQKLRNSFQQILKKDKNKSF
jgi:hypothetical protein